MIQKRETSKIAKLLQKSHKSLALRQLFDSDAQRFRDFSRCCGELLFDFSRTNVNAEAFHDLMRLAAAGAVESARERLFAGDRINASENRSVLHPVWRSRDFAHALPGAEARACSEALRRMGEMAAALRLGQWPGEDSAIRHILHVGIGGSLLGPRLLCEAFPGSEDIPTIHFLSSVDAGDRERLLARIRPRECVLVLVSKSFTTEEVLSHALRLHQWLADEVGETRARGRTIAVTAARGRARAHGVPEQNILDMGEWTGGRFSLWSPVSLGAAVAMGPGSFERLCAGGAGMDQHFRETPVESNLPVIHALLSCWHRNVLGFSCRGLIPYDSRLRSLPAWLQQLEMESNGKSVTRSGDAVAWDTAPVIVGETGTDAQHALFQAFHQGTEVVPLDFIGVIAADHGDLQSQELLLANLLAQATALAFGRNEEETRKVLEREGRSADEIAALLPHRLMPGNRPCSLLLLDRLTPENLGWLLVLYEHSVFVESVIWDINAFDQWGVELGKELAKAIAPVLARDRAATVPLPRGLDGLLRHIRERLHGN